MSKYASCMARCILAAAFGLTIVTAHAQVDTKMASAAPATAKKPDREWFDVSAKGLLEAAKAVASLTAPVTAAVKAVLEFFKP